MNSKIKAINERFGGLFKKLIKAFWILFIVGTLSLVMLFVAVFQDWGGWFGGMPELASLENAYEENSLASELYSEDGELLGKYYLQNRSPVTYDKLSPNLVNALKAIEDIRFEDHAGIDLKGTLAIPVYNLLGKNRGASTITQQLAKNLFKTNDYEGSLTKNNRLLRRGIAKIKEWIIAVKLERTFTKEEILALYLNTIEYANNTYGIRTAARYYFDQETDSLTVPQAALFAGILNAPSRYNPKRHPDDALHRRNVVMSQMAKYGFISEDEYDTLRLTDLNLKIVEQTHNDGLAPYFREDARQYLKKWAKENGYDLYRDGLKIYSTINAKMQRYAEEALKEHMAELQKKFIETLRGREPWVDGDFRVIPNFLESRAKNTAQYRAFVNRYGEGDDSVEIMMNTKVPTTVFTWEGEKDTLMSPMDSLSYYKHMLQAGFVAINPQNGEVKAWVGGNNYKYFQYDHVGQSKRQPGSTFKPFVYTAAIEQGYSPCFEVMDSPYTFHIPGGDPPTWTPANAEGKYTNEDMTLRQAMARSVNSITANMMDRVTPQRVVNIAHQMGIQSKIDPVPALCLGVSEVTLLELIGAYGTFANLGFWNKPHYITRIEDKNGNIIHEFTPKSVQALSEETAYVMLHMLKGGVEEEGGTALGLSRNVRVDNEIGGKTGTTNNASDGWFVGVTADLVGGAWVGGDEPVIHFRSWYYGQGGKTALPIYDKFMQKVYADEELDVEKRPFPRPTKPITINLNCDTDNEEESDSTAVDDDVVQPDAADFG
ncbi:transglycosylase domain-containing protein [Mangrovivirga sp. M17]|uniref:Transglycosylase domain-containing protein n=1 Tax=Mangrovivirga halotolerans TaxID=2993936 RepID=A0ABT3RVY6_9BACT|nr:transglycosylase domain-containing protein [Mangrovivirga halotolerans]MCX2745939.1 transglycosylase domain-containing protein [Mangrovivirga halotolerans]